MERRVWLAEKRDEIKSLYDRVFAVDYDLRFPSTSQTHRTFVKHVLDQLRPDHWILDAGCGTGKYWTGILDRGLGVVGVDQSEQMIWRAREKFPGIRTVVTGIQDFDEPDSFEAVFCIDVLELVAPEDWQLSLANFERALRPGGILYLTVENADPADLDFAYDEAIKLHLPVVKGEVAHAGYYHFHPQHGEVVKMIEESGLKPTHQGLGGGYTHFLAAKV